MTTSTQKVVREVVDVLEGVFGSLEPLVDCMQEAFARDAARRADLVVIDPLAHAALSREDGLIVGAGFVAAPGAVHDAEYWLQWWSDYDTPRRWEPQQLLVEVDPQRESFNDYTSLPWFTAPQEDRHRHVTGPYVDFLCTDEYTLTFTVPIVADDVFKGVVGADVYARVTDSLLAPILEGIGEPAALLNGVGRVVTAGGSTHATGDMVREPALSALLAQLPGDRSVVRLGDNEVWVCSDLGLAVVVGPSVEG